MASTTQLRGRSWPLPAWPAPRQYFAPLNVLGAVRVLYAHIRLAEMPFDGSQAGVDTESLICVGDSTLQGTLPAAISAACGLTRPIMGLGRLEPLAAISSDYSGGGNNPPGDTFQKQGWPASLFLRIVMLNEGKGAVALQYVSPDGIAWTYAGIYSFPMEPVQRVAFVQRGPGVSLLDWIRLYDYPPPPDPGLGVNPLILANLPPTGGRIFTP